MMPTNDFLLVLLCIYALEFESADTIWSWVPYLRITLGTQNQRGQNDTLFKDQDPQKL